MCLRSGLLLACITVVIAAAGADDQPAPTAAEAKLAANLAAEATHEQVAAVTIQGNDGKTKLQTICLDAEGRVLCLVAPPRGFGQSAKNAVSEVQVLSPEGKPVARWQVNFHGQAINAGPDGTIYVAGDGRVARLDKAGKAAGDPVELPHVTDFLKNRDELRAKAEAQLKQERGKSEASKKAILERKDKILAKKAEERTKTETKQLEQFEAILKSYEEAKGQKVETILESMVGRMKVINGIAVSQKDVFVACGDNNGYGYAIWRFDRDLKNPKQVAGGLGGCCGQMDVQVSGADFLVAENTRHRFSRYDRDGQLVGHFGKRSQPMEADGFGGCCNPMNLRTLGKTGDIFTAESEGIVKRFSEKGEFLGVAGTVKVPPGCKNASIGVAPDGRFLYFCDNVGGRVLILGQKGDKK